MAAPPAVTAQLDRADIALGDSAQLNITVSGSGNEAVSPPVVPGLEFVSVGQSSQYQSINGVATSTTSMTYQVIPQRAGTFTIPALSRGSSPLVLRVQPGNGRSRGAAGNNSSASSLPPPASNGLPAGETSLTQDGSAFARLLLPKRELYVGETVPVDIQVGLRPGLVASLNGLPSLNGDSFTLNKLSSAARANAGNNRGQTLYPADLAQRFGRREARRFLAHRRNAAHRPNAYRAAAPGANAGRIF